RGAYTNSVGKKVAQDKAFSVNGYNNINSFEDAVFALSKEHEENMASLDPFDEKGRTLELKEYNKAVDFIKSMKNVWDGSATDQQTRKFIGIFKNLAATAYLGNMPLSMLTDYGRMAAQYGVQNV